MCSLFFWIHERLYAVISMYQLNNITCTCIVHILYDTLNALTTLEICYLM